LVAVYWKVLNLGRREKRKEGERGRKEEKKCGRQRSR
jgi:hypothetical protein